MVSRVSAEVVIPEVEYLSVVRGVVTGACALYKIVYTYCLGTFLLEFIKYIVYWN